MPPRVGVARVVTAAVLSGFVLAGCASGDGRQLAPAVAPPPPPPTTTPPTTPDGAPVGQSLDLVAPWADGGPIPAEYGCGTTALAPSLAWSGVGAGTVELLVTIAVDGVPTDALVGIPASAPGLDAGAVPAGAFWWPPSDVGRRWAGVCGGADVTFTLYALNQQLEAADDAGVAEVASIAELTATGSDTVTGSVAEPATTSSP
jgi:hypothetical protein